MFDFLPKKLNEEPNSQLSQQRKSWKLWNRFLRKSQETVIEETRAATEALESVYEDELRQATTRMESQFGEAVETAQQEFGKFLVRLEEESSTAQKKKMEEFDRVVDEALGSFTAQLLAKITVEEERVRQEVEAHKKAAMEKVSQKAIEVLEKVTRMVIGKSLSSTDQADLVIEAIDQAKKEEFL